MNIKIRKMTISVWDRCTTFCRIPEVMHYLEAPLHKGADRAVPFTSRSFEDAIDIRS